MASFTLRPRPPATLLPHQQLSATKIVLSLPSIIAASSKNRRRRGSAGPGKSIRQCISTAFSALRLLPVESPRLVPGYGGRGGGGSDFRRWFGWSGSEWNGKKKMLGIDAVFVSVAIVLVFGRRAEEVRMGVRAWSLCLSLMAGGRRACSRRWVVGMFYLCLLMAAAAGFKFEKLARPDLAPFRCFRERKTKTKRRWRSL